jgi:hypothetical protein
MLVHQDVSPFLSLHRGPPQGSQSGPAFAKAGTAYSSGWSSSVQNTAWSWSWSIYQPTHRNIPKELPSFSSTAVRTYNLSA